MAIVEYEKLNTKEQVEFLLDQIGLRINGEINKPINIIDILKLIDNSNISINKGNLQKFLDRHNLFSPSEKYPFAHIWPSYEGSDQRLLSTESFVSRNTPFIDERTPIVSLGSCFAIEIARWLQIHKLNYVVTEPNLLSSGVHGSSARWGTIFNSPAFMQVVKWAFGESKPPLVVYPLGGKYRDPFREDVEYNREEVDNLHKIWNDHLICSRRALLEADVIIVTLGLNEVFEYLPTGHFFHRTPWRFNPAFWTERILTIQENVDFIKSAVSTVKKHKPSTKFIFSVSPVPLFRTFRKNMHVAEATMHSKATIRIALEEVCSSLNDCYYMPSFERVMYPGEDNPWSTDYRHVNTDIVSKIMEIFKAMFFENK